VWLLVWAAVVVGLVYLVRRREPEAAAGERVERVLAGRYARGVIDDKEYRERSRVLQEQAAKRRLRPWGRPGRAGR
jgi:uncharacterized membrane protein